MCAVFAGVLHQLLRLLKCHLRLGPVKELPVAGADRVRDPQVDAHPPAASCLGHRAPQLQVHPVTLFLTWCLFARRLHDLA